MEKIGWLKQYTMVSACCRGKFRNQNWRYGHWNNHFGLITNFCGLFFIFFRDHPNFGVFQGSFQDLFRPEACNKMFSFEFCEISKNTFLAELVWATASKHFNRHIIIRTHINYSQATLHRHLINIVCLLGFSSFSSEHLCEVSNCFKLLNDLKRSLDGSLKK